LKIAPLSDFFEAALHGEVTLVSFLMQMQTNAKENKTIRT